MSIVRDTSRHILVSGLSLLISFLYQIFLTRLVGIEHIARVQSIFSLQVIFSTLFLSYNMSFTRMIVRGAGSSGLMRFVRFLHRSHRIHLILTIVIVAVYFVFLGSHATSLGFIEGAATVLFFLGSFLFNSFQAITAGLQRFKLLSYQVFFFHVFRLGTLLLIGLFSKNPSIVMVAIALSAACINVYCVLCVKDYLRSPPAVEEKSPGGPFSPENILGQRALLLGNIALAVLANADVIIMRFVSSTAEAGNYSATATFTRALYLLIAAAGSIIFPFLLKSQTASHKITRSLLIFFSCVLVGCLGLSQIYPLVPSEFFVTLLGPGYASIGRYIADSTYMYAAIGCLSIQFSIHSASTDNRFAIGLFFVSIVAVSFCCYFQLSTLAVVWVLTGAAVLLNIVGFFLHAFAFTTVLLDERKSE